MFDYQKFTRNRESVKNIYENHNFIIDRITENLFYKVQDIKYDINKVLVLGANQGISQKYLKTENIKEIINVDCAEAMLENCENPILCNYTQELEKCKKYGPFDLVFSSMYLHCVNKPDEYFKTISPLLKSEGAFVIAVPSNNNIKELAYSLLKAENEISKEVHLRVHPFMGTTDLGNVLMASGLRDIVVDRDKIEIMYKDPIKAFYDIKGIGMSNSMDGEGAPVYKNLFTNAAKILQSISPEPEGAQVSAETSYAIGWKK